MLIYICSRYRADSKDQFKKQMEYTKECAKAQVLLGHDVVVPHLYYPLFLDDDKEDERELGLASAINLMQYCDTILVCPKRGISAGMEAEIKVAKANNMNIVIL